VLGIVSGSGFALQPVPANAMIGFSNVLGVCAAEEMKSGTRFFDLSERATIDFHDAGKGVGTPENVEN
jgi:hypothetical protein